MGRALCIVFIVNVSTATAERTARIALLHIVFIVNVQTMICHIEKKVLPLPCLSYTGDMEGDFMWCGMLVGV